MSEINFRNIIQEYKEGILFKFLDQEYIYTMWNRCYLVKHNTSVIV